MNINNTKTIANRLVKAELSPSWTMLLNLVKDAFAIARVSVVLDLVYQRSFTELEILALQNHHSVHVRFQALL